MLFRSRIELCSDSTKSRAIRTFRKIGNPSLDQVVSRDRFTISFILPLCCQSKPTGEQRHATLGAGRLPGLLVGPGPAVNGPRSGTRPGLKSLGVPPEPVPDKEGVMY
jgi:hypothetical protein